MQQSVSTKGHIAKLGGAEVVCASQDDADGIARADEILAQLDNESPPREVFEYLSALLKFYGRERASRTLKGRHQRQLSD